MSGPVSARPTATFQRSVSLTRAELRDVGLADDDRSRGADPLDDQIVGGGDVVGEQGRPAGGADARSRVRVLDRHRQPM
jgi:hypothetical protein